MTYRHTQFGWFTLGTTLLIFSVVAAALWSTDPATLVFAAIAIVFVGLLLVADRRHRQPAAVDQNGHRTHPPLHTAEQHPRVSPVTNRWYTVGRSPYAIRHALQRRGAARREILFENGRRVRIGTDEPDALVRALTAATSKPGMASPDEFPRDPAMAQSGSPDGCGNQSRRRRVDRVELLHLQPAAVCRHLKFRFNVGTGMHGADVALATSRA